MIFFDKMIKYILEDELETVVFYEKNQFKSSNLRKILKNLAIANLFSIEGYHKSVEMLFNYKRNSPVYFNSKLVIFIIGKERKYAINFKAISSYIYLNNKISFKFYDGEILNVKVNKKTFYSLIDRVLIIIGYKEKISLNKIL